MRHLTLIALVTLFSLTSLADYSSLLSIDNDGKLEYSTDTNGHRFPDFSYAGYKLGMEAIPKDINPVVVVNSVTGDNTTNIQNAIDYVSSLTMNADGFRGVVLLKAGLYEVSSTLRISTSGVVLRGEGPGNDGTIIFHSGTDAETTLSIGPTAGGIGTTEKSTVTSGSIAVGENSFQVDTLSDLAVGQTIFVKCFHTQHWVDTLGLTAYWNPANFTISWERNITAIDTTTKTITVDAPFTSKVDNTGGYTSAKVYVTSSDARLSQVGVENIMFISDYDRTEVDANGYYNDEDHATRAINFGQAKDCWVQRCVGFFYEFSFVYAWTNCNRITVQDCAMLDGVSLDTPTNHAGAREYYFCMDGSNMLVQRCYTRGARHAFVADGAKSNITFLHCYSEDGHLSPEPHQTYTSAVLYDNVYSDSTFKLHGIAGAHGQAAANSALWNCVSENRRWWEPEIWLNTAPGNLATNWAIGCLINGSHTEPAIENYYDFGTDGYTESIDTHVEPRSLYMAQQRDRCGEASLYLNSTNKQYYVNEAVYVNMLAKYGSFPSFQDPDTISTWAPDAPSYDAAIADENNLVLLDEEESMTGWRQAVVSTTQAYSGTTSAYWDGVNEDGWNYMVNTSMPKDWSAYDTISFAMYSAVANDARVTMIIPSENSNYDGGDYYLYYIDIDWSGWKVFDIPFTSFQGARSPVGWHKIDKVGFWNKGYSAIIKSDTELYIDCMQLKKSTERVLLSEEESMTDWLHNTPSMTFAAKGVYSAKWEGVNEDGWNYIKTDFATPEDWTAYSTVNFSLYSAVANDARVTMIIPSENENVEGGDYYLYYIDIDWVGWKTFEIPFTSFTSVRSPVGWNYIQRIGIWNKGYGAIIKSDTELYLDNVYIK